MPRALSGLPVVPLAGLSLLFVVVGAFRSSSSALLQSTATVSSSQRLVLQQKRFSPLDLEVGGDLAGVPAGSTRYLKREDLLALPQKNYTVGDDANFKRPTQISGIPLEELAEQLSAAPKSDMVVALCNDRYRVNFPHSYVAVHEPLLVLEVNGQPPSGWPKDPEHQGFEMGPYLISHAHFEPAFHVLAHADEPQIPWGVTRIEFRNELKTFAAIAPRGPQAGSEQVQGGYQIAKQNCFRCHNNGNEGGQKAGRSWDVLSIWATTSPERFAAYVREPKKMNPRSLMQGNPEYDQATLQGLISYFQTFQSQVKP